MVGMAHAMGATMTRAQKLKFVTCSFFNLGFAPPYTPINYPVSSTQHIYLSNSIVLHQGTCTPWGYKASKQGVGRTKSFRDVRPEN